MLKNTFAAHNRLAHKATWIVISAVVLLLGHLQASNRGNTTAPPSKKVQRLQLDYCGCAGEEKLRQDQKSVRRLRKLDRDDLCGLNDIVFRNHYQKTFEPTELEDLPIFQVINHTENATKSQVVKDERPAQTYIELGILECPLNWYYRSTLEGYLQKKTAAVGGHALLLMETYEIDRVVVHEAVETVAEEEAFLMSVNAKVIRFFEMDEKATRWRREFW